MDQSWGLECIETGSWLYGFETSEQARLAAAEAGLRIVK